MLRLYLPILLGVVALWVLASGAYRPFGRFVSRILKDAMNQMEINDEKESKK